MLATMPEHIHSEGLLLHHMSHESPTMNIISFPLMWTEGIGEKDKVCNNCMLELQMSEHVYIYMDTTKCIYPYVYSRGENKLNQLELQFLFYNTCTVLSLKFYCHITQV